jgi:hypothetical protein
VRCRGASSNLDFPEMQDIQLPSPDLCARWEEQVPYFRTREFSKCLAERARPPSYPVAGASRRPARRDRRSRPGGGQQPRSDPRFLLADPAAQCNAVGSPRPSLVADVDVAPAAMGPEPVFPRARAGERKGSQNKRPRSGQLLNRAAPRPPSTTKEHDTSCPRGSTQHSSHCSR